MTYFCMKYNSGLNWINQFQASVLFLFLITLEKHFPMFSEGVGGIESENLPEISLIEFSIQVGRSKRGNSVIVDKSSHLNVSFYPLRSCNPVVLNSGVFGESVTLVDKTNPKPILRLFVM